MRAAVLLFALGACHSTDPADPGADATSAPDARPHDIRLVSSQVYGPLAVQDAVTVPFVAVDEANVLLLTMTLEDAQGQDHYPIIETDRGNAFHQWGVAYGQHCGAYRLSLTFSLSPREDVPGATSAITLRVGGNANLTVAVMEFSGLSSQWPRHASSSSLATAPPAFPQVVAEPGDIVVSTASACGVVDLPPSSDFTLLDSRAGVATAYRVVETAGSYGAAWTMVDPSWDAITTSYR